VHCGRILRSIGRPSSRHVLHQHQHARHARPPGPSRRPCP
jgi:hypothetical protein